MGHKNPIKEAQRRFAEKPPARWAKTADALSDRAARKRDKKRTKRGQN